MNKAAKFGYLQSSTTPSKGGLAISLAIATIGSGLGAKVDISSLSDDPDIALFSESNSRFLVTVKPKDKEKFENLFANISIFKIGKVVTNHKLIISNLASLEIDNMSKNFKETLDKI